MANTVMDENVKAADDAAPRPKINIASMIWLGPAVAWLAIFAFFAVFGGENGFVTASGTAGWLNIAAELGIIAIPVGLLMMAGEFDLSTGSMVGAASIIVAVGRWPVQRDSGRTDQVAIFHRDAGLEYDPCRYGARAVAIARRYKHNFHEG
jgi:ABC-type xylose transport system permease subunit